MQAARRASGPLLRCSRGVGSWTGGGGASSSRPVAGGLGDSLTGGSDAPGPPFDRFDLMAVPKRKVTPSRKGMRSTHKQWKAAPVVAQCSLCGRVMQQHHVPHKCGEIDCPSMKYSRSGAEISVEPATPETGSISH